MASLFSFPCAAGRPTYAAHSEKLHYTANVYAINALDRIVLEITYKDMREMNVEEKIIIINKYVKRCEELHVQLQ